MTETIAALEQRLRDTIDRRLKPVEDELKEHRKTLFGNGVPGWDEMLRTLYADYLERKEAEKEKRKTDEQTDKQTRLQRIIGSWQFQIALLNGIFLVVVEIVEHFAK
ncbi:MAG TPA: hypothetical protein VIY48_02335 [Candidatus Paceibacterota bacterium]